MMKYIPFLLIHLLNTMRRLGWVVSIHLDWGEMRRIENRWQLKPSWRFSTVFIYRWFSAKWYFERFIVVALFRRKINLFIFVLFNCLNIRTQNILNENNIFIERWYRFPCFFRKNDITFTDYEEPGNIWTPPTPTHE